MKKKQIELMEYLLSTSSVATSKELAAALNLSPRSIKNYVMEINLLGSERIIHSSKSGYTINVNAAKALLQQAENAIPQSWEERASYIVKQLMLEHTSHLDLYELCEKLYIGYSTLKSDISRMNKAYENFNVSFVCENECLKIVGEEKNKRKLISYMVQEETSNQVIDIQVLKDSFPSIDIDTVSNLIQNTFHDYHYYINDFSLINLLLHFAIIIDRLKEGNHVEREGEEIEIESAHEKALVQELCKKLEEQFHIVIDRSERAEIYMLFKTNANYSLPNDEDNVRRIIGESVWQASREIVEKINEEYLIDLAKEEFMTPFSLHIKNLILRVQSNRYTKNPMVESIKTSCPTVYDIAIFTSIELMHRFHIHINEDEVAFLALHIGAEIERQKTNDAKIQCVLLCPDYMHMTTQLYNQLLINFGNQINIVKTSSYESDFDELEYDFLITTIPLTRVHEHPVYQLPPFRTQMNIPSFLEALESFRQSKKNYILKKNFHDFFYEGLFLANPKEATREEIIHLLATKMLDAGFVEEDFERKVLIREHAASTAFGHIAIPHSMEMEALKTCIGVAISKRSILWGENKVHVVLLIAMNRADKQTFRELYEALILLFSEDQVIDYLKECKIFSDFESIVYSCIGYKK